jgi:hypothetical protein
MLDETMSGLITPQSTPQGPPTAAFRPRRITVSDPLFGEFVREQLSGTGTEVTLLSQEQLIGNEADPRQAAVPLKAITDGFFHNFIQ